MRKLSMLISLLLVLAICLSSVGCGSKKDESGTSVDDGFFTDIEVGLESNADSESNGDRGESEPGNNESKDNTSKVSSDKTTSGPKSTVLKENKVGGKSWKEVLASMPKQLRGTTIVMYNWNPAYEYTGAPAVIEKFQKETGIKIEWKTENYDTYLSKLASMVAANNPPDVVRLRTPDPIGLLSIQPISATGYDYSDEAWDQLLMKDYTINGKVYGTSLNNTHIGSVAMLLYNSALISKYDLDNPYQLWKKGKWTWSKFIDICEDFKKLSGAEFACGGSGWTIWAELYGVPGPVGYDGTKYFNNTGNSKFIQITQEIADLYNTSRLFGYWKSDEFNKGDCLFWAGASVYARRKNSYFSSLKSAGTLSVVPFPEIDGQGKYYQALDEYEAYGIAKGAKNPKAVP